VALYLLRNTSSRSLRGLMWVIESLIKSTVSFIMW
jgi:hypothetical protein